MYSTSAFARLAGVTIKVLRHYERVGLLAPKRTRAQYRRYAIADLHRLERILALKSLGLPLASIKGLLQQPSTSWRAHRQMLEERRARLDRAIEAIRAIEQHTDSPAAVQAFIREATWNRWETLRQRRAAAAPRAPDRASPAKVALFEAISAALAEDPAGPRARALVAEWRAAMDPDTSAALKHRATWPSGMRRYVASLYEATPAAWERIVAFIEQSA